VFGNTELLAAAVRTGLSNAGADAWLTDVRDEDQFREHLGLCSLMVVAVPDAAQPPAWSRLRLGAGAGGPDDQPFTEGAKAWLGRLDAILAGPGPRPPVAVFETRLPDAQRQRSALRRARRGFGRASLPVVDTTRFIVDGGLGLVSSGEIERAKHWGADLLMRLPSAAGTAGVA
jgi:hypothetical protein